MLDCETLKAAQVQVVLLANHLLVGWLSTLTDDSEKALWREGSFGGNPFLPGFLRSRWLRMQQAGSAGRGAMTMPVGRVHPKLSNTFRNARTLYRSILDRNISIS
jgi:hypothetical protein